VFYRHAIGIKPIMATQSTSGALMNGRGAENKQNRPGEGSRAAPDDLLSQAVSLQNAKDFEAAEQIYRRYLSTRPKHLVALNNAAVVAKALGRHNVALVRLGKALRHHPDSADAHYNLGNTLQELGRLEEAVSAYRRTIDLRPGYVSAHLNLGNALDKQCRFGEAVASYRNAITFGGDDAETHCNLGNSYKAQNLFREALTHYICAATQEPDRAEFHYNAGMVRFETRAYPEAIASFRRVVELDPAHDSALSLLLFLAQTACDWEETDRLRPLVRAATDKALATGALCREGPLESISRDADPARNLAVTASFARQFIVPAAAGAQRAAPARRQLGPIRLGYLSADFRDHAVAHVMGGVFGRHDRTRFNVSAYAYGTDDKSPWRRRIERDCDRFVDFYGINDLDAARTIAQDNIDILIDLTVWTRGSRPRISALRPAAVQIQYLGFPGTSGSPFYDYAMVDRTVAPPEHRAFWSEALIHLPGCYFMVDRDQPIATSNLNRGNFGLAENQFVFCSFNQSFKIDRSVFLAWMKILAAVPGSVLWLANSGAVIEANLVQDARRHGVDPARLIFADRIDDKAQHLQRLGLADLVLDTPAYNGHTSTADALLAGVPVITVAGGHFASRVSASLLQAADLEALIADHIDAYVEHAIQLAASPALLGQLRARLKIARAGSVLFDTERSVAGLETAYERVWANFLTGAAPADIVL
jgi:predicted O-linked N-acetylglucosamine transferase (SPINDLY family)